MPSLLLMALFISQKFHLKVYLQSNLEKIQKMIKLLKETKLLNEDDANSLLAQIGEIQRMLIASLKTVKREN